MSANELCRLDCSELSRKITAKDISPVELTEACLDRIEALNPAINAFITVAADRALSEAAEAEKEVMAGRIRSPLHGIPVGIKDIIDTAGVRTTSGSRFFSDNVPSMDAECVRRLRECGAIVIGKCNTGEFAAESATKNPHYGPCRNPWDTDRVPAGSSGGSGAAVAAGMVPIALGSDTAGSVRGPAAICGVVGMKPTYGRVSVRGVCPNSTTLDHIGPLSRTVRDSALLLQAIAGYDRDDPFSVELPESDLLCSLEDGIKGAKFALCPDLIDVEIDRPILDAFEASLAILRDLGAEIETIEFPDASGINPHRRAIGDAELFHFHAERFASKPDWFGETLRERLETAQAADLAGYLEGQRYRTETQRKLADALTPYDALLSPGYPCLAAPVETTMATVNGKEVQFIGLARNLLGVQNFVGFPALSVPNGFDPDLSLPIGLQITTLPGQEAAAYRIGRAYENATPEFRARFPEIGSI
jgi:aspartyl-tRNA(Asn)/glutamyl-tRNA(Gln) amidotransferase subunit A